MIGYLIRFSINVVFAFEADDKFLPFFTSSALALVDNNTLVIAAYVITLAVVNMLSSTALSLQNLIVCFDTDDKDNKHKIKIFGIYVSSLSVILLFLIGFTPLGDYVIYNIFNATAEIGQLSKLIFKFSFLAPYALLYQKYYFSYLIKIKKTYMLIFERILSIIIPYSMFFFIKIISWDKIAIIAILIMPICNIAAGIYSNIVCNYFEKKKFKNIETV